MGIHQRGHSKLFKKICAEIEFDCVVCNINYFPGSATHQLQKEKIIFTYKIIEI